MSALNLITAFAEQAAARPEVRFIEDDRGALTWAEGLTRVGRLAGALRAAGVGPGDRVATLFLNRADAVLLTLACSQLQACLVPINWRLAPAEIAYILGDCGDDILFVLDELFEPLARAVAANPAPGLTLIGPTEDPAWQDFAGWLDAYDGPSIEIGPGAPGFETCILQMYTSGTTGHPKGVMLSVRNLSGCSSTIPAIYGEPAGHGCTELVCAPLFHIGGMGSVLKSVMLGESLVMCPVFDPVTVADLLGSGRIDRAFLVPAMIQAMVQGVPDIAERDYRYLKLIAYGASPINAALLEQALGIFGCRFAQLYGMTETTGAVVGLTADDHDSALAGHPELLEAAGRPLPGVEMIVADEAGAPLPPGRIGQVMIRSGQNMLGYWNNPAATAETLQDGWVATGDAGLVDDAGYLFLRDRVKDMIVSGGENIYPIEIEQVVARHPDVADVAVIGVPDETFGERPLAVCVLRPGATLDAGALTEYCRQSLAGYKLPRQLSVVEELPRNPSGKVLKRTLREPYWEGQDRKI